MPTTLGIIASHRTAPTGGGLPVAGAVAWWDASDAASITHSAGAVSQWNDKSGGNRHVTQATAAAKPATGTATRNGRNVLVFDGGDVLNHAGTTGVNVGNATVFVVGGESVAVDYAGLLSLHQTIGNDYDNDKAFTLNTGSAAYHAGIDRNSIASASAGSGAAPFGVFSAQVTTTGHQVWVNGVPGGAASNASPLYVANGGYVIGGRYLSGVVAATSRLNGQIAEVIVYDRVLSAVERQQAETYLKNKWGTP